MSNFDYKNKSIDYVARIISFATKYRINTQVITDVLASSDFIEQIENNNYSSLYEKSPQEIYIELFGKACIYDGNPYDEGYWCGYVYMNIFYKYKKPLSYIFLKMPLNKLLEMYDVYHEMDISEVYEEFEILEKRNTILNLLLIKHDISATKLSRDSDVNLRTIENFKKSDDNLYNASYANVQRIGKLLNEPGNMFLKSI